MTICRNDAVNERTNELPVIFALNDVVVVVVVEFAVVVAVDADDSNHDRISPVMFLTSPPRRFDAAATIFDAR